MNCKYCKNKIEGYSNKVFCDSLCRKRANRKSCDEGVKITTENVTKVIEDVTKKNKDVTNVTPLENVTPFVTPSNVTPSVTPSTNHTATQKQIAHNETQSDENAGKRQETPKPDKVVGRCHGCNKEVNPLICICVECISKARTHKSLNISQTNTCVKLL